MKFQRIEFSWRAAFIGLYMTPERDKAWVTILPFKVTWDGSNVLIVRRQALLYRLSLHPAPVPHTVQAGPRT